VIAYLPDKLQQAGITIPKDLSILLDPRLAGHVAVPDVNQPNWSGVMPALVAFFGNSLDDPAPTLSKLAALKGLVLYNSSSDLEARMSSGEVWVSLWTDGRVNGLKAKGVNIEIASEGIPNPQGGTFDSTAAPTVMEISNPANKDLAEAYIDAVL